jgi:hypothetical protein
LNIEWLKIKLALAMLLTLSLAVLPGCSMLRISYGQLDTFALWTVDDYFDLDPVQKHDFDKRFDRLHEWHRHEQLPDYAAFFMSARTRVQKGLARDDIAWLSEGLRERYRTIIRHVADDAAALLLTVTPAQLDALKRQFEKDNRRFVREFHLEEGADQQRRAASKRVLARIRDWTGSLSDDQEQKIAALAAELPMNHRLRFEDRMRRQRGFLQLMAQRGDPARFPAVLRHWLLNWEEGRAPEYERVWSRWMEKQADFYVAVDRMLTPHQREHVTHRLQSYANDFTYLAQRPATQAAQGR